MLNSTETRIQVTPWPLTPAPSIVDLTNTTITVEVVLDNQLRYEPVTNVGMQVIKASHYPNLRCPYIHCCLATPYILYDIVRFASVKHHTAAVIRKQLTTSRQLIPQAE